ncbi:MAG TPA: helix-turn-helix domain-containing protein [Solirubrobacteraceae bacterium]|nr:helix-turn-helix domain-containing protein [Solirubrobacteraceae bacterium]
MTRDQVDEQYLTVAEVAELLRLNQQTVRNWIDQGSLPALRVGRRVRIKRSDFERLVSDGYSAGSPAGGADAGPSAEDFWGGEPVGFAEPAAGAQDEPAAGVQDEPGTGAAEPRRANGSSAASGTDPSAPASADPPR